MIALGLGLGQWQRVFDRVKEEPRYLSIHVFLNKALSGQFQTNKTRRRTKPDSTRLGTAMNASEPSFRSLAGSSSRENLQKFRAFTSRECRRVGDDDDSFEVLGVAVSERVYSEAGRPQTCSLLSLPCLTTQHATT